MSHLKIILLALSKKMWPKVTAFACIGICCALSAFFFKNLIPDEISKAVGAEAAVNILSILASSMLAVTTFSLSTMVSAYGSATSSASPRATTLITEDKTTQNALSIFLGAFVFSLVGIIALNMGIYQSGGRLILFVATLIVMALIIIIFIQWIDRLTTLGRVGETSRLVEKAALKAIENRARHPAFGCNCLSDELVIDETRPVLKADENGYLCFVEIDKLSQLAEKADSDLYIMAKPGDYIHKGKILCRTSKLLTEQEQSRLRKCFTMRDHREFEQDPLFGIMVLAEIGSRAASEAMRDHGTAIDIVIRVTRVLEAYYHLKEEEQIRFPRLWMPELSTADLFREAYSAIARESAPMFEVHLHLHQALAHLFELDDAAYQTQAVKYAGICLEYSDKRLLIEEEKEVLHAMAVNGSAHAA